MNRLAAATLVLALAPLALAQEAKDDGAVEQAHEEMPAPSASASARSPLVVREVVPEQDGMVRIPGGRFTMGSSDPRSPPNERPPHATAVSPFWIDKTETTVRAYRACVDRQACRRPARSSRACTFDMGEPDLPVTCVTWRDAEDFCRSAKKRLPREAEWELAARGTHALRYPWGGGVSHCGAAATLVHDGSSRPCTGDRPARVGSHPSGASPYGVLDLAGNAEEWTADWYAESTAEGVAPRTGSSRVLRGGAWSLPPSQARTTSRNWGSAAEAGPTVGFRCVRDDAR